MILAARALDTAMLCCWTTGRCGRASHRDAQDLKPGKGVILSRVSLRLAEGRPQCGCPGLLIGVILAAAAMSVEARARVQTEMLCWEADMEFPAPCDDDN